MDTWLIVAIAVPFLFIIGVVYNAIKDQKKLEQNQLRKVLQKRYDRESLPPDHKDHLTVKPYDDADDDYGLPERQDKVRAAKYGAAATATLDAKDEADIKGDDHLDRSDESDPHKLGPTNFEAKHATDYFSKYH